MTKIAPMTAAEARKLVVWPYGTSERILAALEEREALLGERDRLREDAEHHRELAGMRLRRINQLDTDNADLRRSADERDSIFVAQKSDASVGALVRRIGELQPSAYLTWAGHPMCYYVKHPSVLQSALDSLLPKEPEVVTGPSGWKYRVNDGRVEWWGVYARKETWLALEPGVLVPGGDAPVVAKLMEGAAHE